MGKTQPRASGDDAAPSERRAGTALDLSGWLALAAAPTFAAMALWTGVHGGDRSDMLCSIAQDASPLNGMVLMYLLMAAFHTSPWLRLMSRRQLSVKGS